MRKGQRAERASSRPSERRGDSGNGSLPEKSGVNIRQIQSFESGERDMRNASLKNALALADALGVHPRELI